MAAPMAGALPGNSAAFSCRAVREWCGPTATGRGEDPEPTRESASRAVVFSLQARDQEQRNLYSSFLLHCFAFYSL